MIIYKILFEDGAAYVGQSRHSLSDRIRRHQHKPDNAELSRRLNAGLPYTATVLHSDVPDSQVYSLERKEILKLEKPINVNGVKPENRVHFGNEILPNNTRRRSRKRYVHPPREGNYICSICSVEKPHTEYHKDTSRFNGLSSRCKPCFNKRQAKAREYHRKRHASQPPEAVNRGKQKCPKCGKRKPKSDFYFYANERGTFTYCKPCSRSRSRSRYRYRYRYPVQEGTYTCGACSEEKPHTDFPKQPQNRSGLSTMCKPCTYKRHNERVREYNFARAPGRYTCLKCKVEKPDTEFYKNKRNKNGCDTYCKGCRSTIYNAYRGERRKQRERQI